MSKYTVTIRNPQLEEYPAGNTLAEARKEAAFFVEHTHASVPVKICKVDFSTSEDGVLQVVEVVREGR